MADQVEYPGRLIAVDGSRGKDVTVAAGDIVAAFKRDGIECAISRWDASGLFTDLAAGGRSDRNVSIRTLSLVYAADLGEALVAAAERPATLNRTYHVAHPDVVTQRELLKAIAAALGRRVNLIPVPGAAARIVLELSGWVSQVTGRRTLLSGDKADELLAPAWTCESREFARDARWSAATVTSA